MQNLGWLEGPDRNQHCDAKQHMSTLPVFIMEPPTVSEFAAAAISALMHKDTANPSLFPE